MPKNRTYFISCMLILLFGLLLASGCSREESAFTGNSIGDETQFLLDFEVLNSTRSNTMQLQKEDEIKTTVEITKGTVDIVVKNEKGTICYQGTDVETSNFSIGIKEEGTYTVSVTGKHAKGSVHFVKTTE